MLQQADKEMDVGKKRRMLRDVQGTDSGAAAATQHRVREARRARRGDELDAADPDADESDSERDAHDGRADEHGDRDGDGDATDRHGDGDAHGASDRRRQRLLASERARRRAVTPRAPARSSSRASSAAAHATSDEVGLLRGICKSQHDKSCTAAIGAKYPQ